MMTINIAKEFSRYPAGRYFSDGPFSGEAFREVKLIPALNKGEKVRIILDGALGYGSSFLEEAFGGLVRNGFSATELKSKLMFVSKEDPFLEEEIISYIDGASTGD